MLDPLSGPFHLVYLCQNTFCCSSINLVVLLQCAGTKSGQLVAQVAGNQPGIYRKARWNDSNDQCQRRNHSSEPHCAPSLTDNSHSKYRPTDNKFTEIKHPILPISQSSSHRRYLCKNLLSKYEQDQDSADYRCTPNRTRNALFGVST